MLRQLFLRFSGIPILRCQIRYFLMRGLVKVMSGSILEMVFEGDLV